jgi:hypothetical protein
MEHLRSIWSGFAAALLAFLASAVMTLVAPRAMHFGTPLEPLAPGTVLTEKEFNARAQAGEAALAAAQKRVKEVGLKGLFRFSAAWYFAFLSPAFVVVGGLLRKRRKLVDLILFVAPALLGMLVLGAEVYGFVLLGLAVAALFLWTSVLSKGSRTSA